MDTDLARTRLEKLLAEIDASSETLVAEHAEESEELSHVDQHPADVGTEVSDQERQAAVLDLMGHQREDVEAALARVEDGSYGLCAVDGKPIPDERLEARPEATMCVEHQAAAEREAAGGTGGRVAT